MTFFKRLPLAVVAICRNAPSWIQQSHYGSMHNRKLRILVAVIVILVLLLVPLEAR